MGPSCSTHNPRPVDPRPRAIGPLKAEVGRTRRRTTTSGCLRGNQKGCEAGKGAGSGIGAPSPGLGAPSGGMRVPGPAATTLAESIRATTLRPSRPLPSTHTRLQDDHTTSSSNLGERLRHEENATPERGTAHARLGARVRPGPHGAPVSVRLSSTTGTFHAAGCVSSRAGSFDAVGDSNPVPQRVTCPRPRGNVTARAGCPRPRHLSVGPPWHPEPLVRQLHRRRRPTTSSGPPTGARSGQVGEGTALPGTPESGRLSSPSLTDQG